MAEIAVGSLVGVAVRRPQTGRSSSVKTAQNFVMLGLFARRSRQQLSDTVARSRIVETRHLVVILLCLLRLLRLGCCSFQLSDKSWQLKSAMDRRSLKSDTTVSTFCINWNINQCKEWAFVY